MNKKIIGCALALMLLLPGCATIQPEQELPFEEQGVYEHSVEGPLGKRFYPNLFRILF